MIKLDTAILLGNGADRDQARGGKIGGALKGPAANAIVLDGAALFGSTGGQVNGAKIGVTNKGATKSPWALDADKLLGRGRGQSAGAKIGQVKEEGPR